MANFLLIFLIFCHFCDAFAFLLWPERPPTVSGTRKRVRDPLFRHSHRRAKQKEEEDGAEQQKVIPNRNPIVLIPGDGGSRLRANLTGKSTVVHYFCSRHTSEFFDLWLNLEQFGPFVIDCWADNMRLDFNTTTGLAVEQPGVRVHIPGLGKTNTVEWLDASKRAPGRYFAPIVDLLTQWGYRRGIDVAGAPFDWRKAPKELSRYFIRLRSLIESLFKANGNRRVIVVAHSMGNPVANYFYHNFVDQAWKDQFMEAHISLAGAWGGAAQIVKLFASGYNLDYYRVLLPPSRLRTMQRSFTSSAFLFPSAGLWNSSEVLASTPSQNYSLSNLEEFFADIEYPMGMAQWQSVRPSLMLGAPGIKVFCLFGNLIDTPERFVWYHDWLFPNYQPYIQYGNGDGTVNQRSLEVCEQWSAANNAGKEVVVQRLNGTDHMGILDDQRMLDMLKQILGEAAKRKNRSKAER